MTLEKLFTISVLHFINLQVKFIVSIPEGLALYELIHTKILKSASTYNMSSKDSLILNKFIDIYFGVSV